MLSGGWRVPAVKFGYARRNVLCREEELHIIRLLVKMFDDEERHKRCEERVFKKLGSQPNVEELIKKRNTSAEINKPHKLR